MKTLFILSLFVSLRMFAHSGDTIYVEQGTSPVIDGVISAGEWDDAETITFTGYNGVVISCYFKYNGDTLYIAQDTPEMIGGDHGYLWFDTDNDGGTAPKTDDFWLSKYYFDGWAEVESSGTGSDWGSWISPINWYGIHTGDGWSYDHGQMEFAIAFNKLGIISGNIKTIGFMMGFGDNPDQTDCYFWPSLGYNHENPNLWADMLISFPTKIKQYEIETLGYAIYPNPTTGIFTVKGNNIISVEIINFNGQVIKQITMNSSQLILNLGEQGKGIYIVKIITEKETIFNKIIKN